MLGEDLTAEEVKEEIKKESEEEVDYHDEDEYGDN